MKLPKVLIVPVKPCWELRIRIDSDRLIVDVWQSHFATKVSSSTFDWGTNGNIVKADYDGALLQVKGSANSVVIPLKLPSAKLSLAHCVGKGDGPSGSQVDTAEANHLELIAQLCDPIRTPTTEKFLEVWQAAYGISSKKGKKKSLPPPQAEVLPKAKQLQLLQRFSNGLPSSLLSQMLDADVFTSVSSQELCDICVAFNDQLLMDKLVSRVENLPERGLIAVVKFYLKQPDVAAVDRSALLSKLIASSLTPIFFEREMKQLTADESAALLVWLVELVQPAMLNCSTEIGVPLEKALTWIGTLLDVHFSTLAVNKNCRVSLLALNECLNQCVTLKTEADKFNELLRFMEEWSKEKVETKQKGVDYWVEILSFD